MLLLVVGPAGAGKDTLLEGARTALAQDERFRFVRRSITRDTATDIEDFESLPEPAFLARRDAGGFALWWRAHGFHYGIPADIALDLQERRIVVVSVSRTVVGEAAARFPVRAVEITAPADTLARRLALRGRDDAVQAAARLARSVPLPPGVPKDTIVNDGTIEQGVRRLVGLLTRIAGPVRAAEPPPDQARMEDAPPDGTAPPAPPARTG